MGIWFASVPYTVPATISMRTPVSFEAGVPFILRLSHGGQLNKCTRISPFSVSRTAVYPRELISFLLIESNATAVILAHNHPGGSAHPSQEDITLTRRVKKLLEGIEVRLLDHLIYAPSRLGQEGSWVSMSGEGHL